MSEQRAPAVRMSWPLAFCAIAIVAIGAFTFIAYRVIATPGDALHTFLDAFKPNQTTVFYSSIEKLNTQPKLVVLTADITASVTDKFDSILNSSVVTVRAPAKVQFYIPLRGIGAKDFRYDPNKRELWMALPEPQLDHEMIVIDYNRAEVLRDSTWNPADYLVKTMQESNCKAKLENSALSEAQSELLKMKAGENTKVVLREFLRPMLESLREDVRFDFEFRKPGR